MTSTYGFMLLLVSVASVAAFALGRWSRRRDRRNPLPKEWALMARPVLNSDERRTLRVLREALPQYIVLAKLPLVRLCHPRDPERVRYWYELLGPLHVSFAVCSANGRVLAVIDIENGRARSRRVTAIKQAVMEACRIRYLSCLAENLPPISELVLLLPQQGSLSRPIPLTPAPNFQKASSDLSDTVRTRRAERSTRWADSGYPQDSFFAPDSRLDALSTGSDFAPSTFGGEPASSGRPGAAPARSL
jgi:hypothetical protein